MYKKCTSSKAKSHAKRKRPKKHKRRQTSTQGGGFAGWVSSSPSRLSLFFGSFVLFILLRIHSKRRREGRASPSFSFYLGSVACAHQHESEQAHKPSPHCPSNTIHPASNRQESFYTSIPPPPPHSPPQKTNKQMTSRTTAKAP